MESVATFNGSALRAVLYGGLIAGALDITYAFVGYGLLGVTPFRILHSVASGWLGKAAYDGGAATAMLGLASHLLITCVAAAIYVLASRRFQVLTAHPLICGGLFGLMVFATMNYVIVPLSAAVVGPPHGVFYPLGVLVHVFFVGVPIALFARGAH